MVVEAETERSEQGKVHSTPASKEAHERQLPPDVSQCEYFHGFLQKEDVALVLERDGDYMFRCVETTTEDGMHPRTILVMDVLVDPKGELLKLPAKLSLEDVAERAKSICHLVLWEKKRSWSADNSNYFRLIPELIKHHTTTPIHDEKRSILLARGMPRAKWELNKDNFQMLSCNTNIAESHTHHHPIVGANLLRGKKILPIALKTLTRKDDEKSRKGVQEALHGARLLRQMSPSATFLLLRCFGIDVVSSTYRIAYEHVDGKRLSYYIRQNKGMDEDDRMLLVMGCAWALSYIHSIGLIHREICAKVFLVDQRKRAKLASLNRARMGPKYRLEEKDTPLHLMAPETLTGGMFTQKSDVYSFGLLIYEIFAISEPYEPLNEGAHAEKLVMQIKTGVVPELPKNMPTKLQTYVKEKLWNRSPLERPDMKMATSWLGQFSGYTLELPEETKTTKTTDEQHNPKSDYLATQRQTEELTQEQVEEIVTKKAKANKTKKTMDPSQESKETTKSPPQLPSPSKKRMLIEEKENRNNETAGQLTNATGGAFQVPSVETVPDAKPAGTAPVSKEKKVASTTLKPTPSAAASLQSSPVATNASTLGKSRLVPKKPASKEAVPSKTKDGSMRKLKDKSRDVPKTSKASTISVKKKTEDDKKASLIQKKKTSQIQTKKTSMALQKTSAASKSSDTPSKTKNSRIVPAKTSAKKK